MAFDPDHRIVLFFGGLASGIYYKDLLAWDGASWTKVGLAPPAARRPRSH